MENDLPNHHLYSSSILRPSGSAKMPEKILIVGPVNGRLTDLVSKISAIQSKHGPFASLFILGDLFSPSPSDSLLQQQSDLLSGTLKLPIATYFYQGISPLSSTILEKTKERKAEEGLVELADNLYYAKGKSGVFVTKEGFRVAFVGGKWIPEAYASHSSAGQDGEEWHESESEREEDETVDHITPSTITRLLAHPSFRLPSPTPSSSSITVTDAKAGTLAAARAQATIEAARSTAQTTALQILQNRPPVDLLLTNAWPTGITLFSTSPTTSDPLGGLPDPTTRMWGSPLIAKLSAHACPRYHFALPPSTPEEGLPVGILEETVAMGAFWERQPYVTDLSAYLPQGAEGREKGKWKQATRFVSLAKFANEKKKRWFLALNLTPADQQKGLVEVPGNATQTPYSVPNAARGEGGKRQAVKVAEVDDGPNFRFSESRKRQKGEGGEEVPPPGYVCRICGVEGHYIRSCPSKPPPPNTDSSATQPDSNGGGWGRSTMPLPPGLPSKPAFSSHPNPRPQLIPVGPSNCWFCLSNPSVAKSLIVTIGAESYLVFPKGPFSHPSINSIPHAGSHLLIVPLTHTSHLLPPTHPASDGGDEEEKRRVRGEMEITKSSVRAVWSREGHCMLEWTLVRVKTSSRMTHFQTQLLALLDTVIESSGLVKKLDDALEAQLNGLKGKKGKVLRNPSDIGSYFEKGSGAKEEDGYFHMILHLEEKKEWLVPLDTQTRFPVQFVRSTLSKIFDLPELADWKTAEVTTEEEEKENSQGLRRLILAQS